MINPRRAALSALALSLLPSCAPDRTPEPPTPPAPDSHAERTDSAPAPQRTLLENGLAISDLAPGHGAPCEPTDTVEIRFTASLAGGAVFDSTDERKRTLTITLDNPSLIRGLREGITGMREGARRRIEIPHALAYGDEGRAPVPPKTDLIYEVELVRVLPRTPAAP